MGIVASVKARLRPIYTPPVWTPERLAGLGRTEEYITFREARASLIAWVVVPDTILAGVTNGNLWIPAVLLMSAVVAEPHLAALRSPFRTSGTNLRRLLSMPWEYWWVRPMMTLTLIGTFQPWAHPPHFILAAAPAAVVWLALAIWVRHKLIHGQKMQVFLQMYRTLGVSRQASTKA